MEAFQVDDAYVKETCYRRWGLSVKKTGVKHWNGPCPVCGGIDRFYVTEHGRCVCNQCDFRAWLDDDQKFKPDPLRMIKRAEIMAQEKEEQARRWEDWSNGFLAGAYWKEWHDKMTVMNRQWWADQGISDEQIDSYELGYLAEKQIKVGEKDLTLPAYTIPIRDLNTLDIVNIHYRLLNPPPGIGKYRYEHGIPAREFYAVPGLTGKAFVCEGAKKAMVTHRFIREYLDHQVIGLPGCTPSEGVLERLKEFDEIWLGLDPGCEAQAKKFKKALPQTRIMTLPDKPDDLWLAGMTIHQFKQYIELAR